jgi:DNA-binding transcriptional LysR family regulator
MVACVPVRLARRMTQMARIDMFDIPLELPLFDVRMLWHPRTQHAPANEWLRRVVVECAQAVAR